MFRLIQYIVYNFFWKNVNHERKVVFYSKFVRDDGDKMHTHQMSQDSKTRSFTDRFRYIVTCHYCMPQATNILYGGGEMIHQRELPNS